VTKREVWETDHGVTMYEPTKARPYYRLTWYTPEGARQAASGGKDRDQAWAKAWDIDAQLAQAVADPSGRIVNDLLNAWLPKARKEYSETHWDKYLRMSERFISPLLGQHAAWTLTREDIKAVLEAPGAESAKRHTRNALGAMLTWGHENDWVEQPYGHFFPRRARTAKQQAGRKHGEMVQFIPQELRPSPEACRALAEAMAAAGGNKYGEQLWLMTAAAASCGPRQGELFAATRSRLRPEVGKWLIDRQVVRVKKKTARVVAALEAADDDLEDTLDGLVVTDADEDTPDGTVRITPPKWGRTRETILPAVTIWGEPFAERLVAYAATRRPDEVLFPAARGGFLHPSNFRRAWLTVARTSAAPEWSAAWSWHSLRHAFCTDLLARGARDTDVALAAGHRDSGVTRAMYVGATEGTADRLNALLGSAP
jgi:hypothetical protein